MTTPPSGFAGFWPDYLRAHRKRSTRLCHYAATLWGAGLGMYGLVTLRLSLALAAVAGGYALAVGSHYLFEGRPPLVARNPVWGALSDFRMAALAVVGRLDAEFDKHGIDPNG
jgi:hypothetical protein